MRVYTQLNHGVSKLGAAIGVGTSIEKKAYADTMANLMADSVRRAQSEKYASETALNDQRLKNMRSGRDTFLRSATGLTEDQYDQLVQGMRHGWAMRQVEGPPTPDGLYPAMEDRPKWATPDVVERYRTGQMALGANDVTGSYARPANLMKAMQDAINIGRQDKMISDQIDPNRVAAAMAAVAGKPTVSVTNSGIGYRPYGNSTQLNTESFLQRANIEAKARVDAALTRHGLNGGELPAEAKMINFYQSLGYSRDRSIEMAKSGKYASLRDLAADMYVKLLGNMSIDVHTSKLPKEQKEKLAEEQVLHILRFLRSNEPQPTKQETQQRPEMNQAPVPGAKKAPDGKWYVQKGSQWYRVDP